MTIRGSDQPAGRWPAHCTEVTGCPNAGYLCWSESMRVIGVTSTRFDGSPGRCVVFTLSPGREERTPSRIRDGPQRWLVPEGDHPGLNTDGGSVATTLLCPGGEDLLTASSETSKLTEGVHSDKLERLPPGGS